MKKIYYIPWKRSQQETNPTVRSTSLFFRSGRRSFRSIDTAIRFAVRYRGGLMVVQQSNHLIPLSQDKGTVSIKVVSDPNRTRSDKQFEQIQIQVRTNKDLVFFTDATDDTDQMINQFLIEWKVINNKHLW